MSAQILEKDTCIHFPHFIILKASAGSGKTYALTERFVQFVLSDKISRNNLRNILAVTFSNNAAKEMKERILLRLKSVYFNDPQLTGELLQILSVDRSAMKEKAGRFIDEILDNYSDFQVKTIDSFMATVFKASAIDFGFNAEFDILMSIDALMEYSFDRFLRNIRSGSDEARLFEEIIGIILSQKGKESAYPWDPSVTLLDEIKKIYKKLSSTGKRIHQEDFSSAMEASSNRIGAMITAIGSLIEKSELELHGHSSYETILSAVRDGRLPDIIGKGLKNPPVKKPKKNLPELQESYDRIVELWSEIGRPIADYTACYARSYYHPYLRVYEEFRKITETIKHQQGKIFIEDINRYLAEYLNNEIVPDVYFRIGETIFHFLIDEFQDTSPIQWQNLSPLLENSLSQGGSLFVVGDTKQAIYGFRDADYTIMREAEKKNPFPAAERIIRELETNYRSLPAILDFNEKVFRQIVAVSDTYRNAGEQSGLTDYIQKVREDNKTSGYAEVTLCEKDDDHPPEKQKIQELIRDLHDRGIRYGDIAVLTQTNEDAVRVTSWLNEQGVDFISFSNLDIRRRKITGEIIALLNFLDSPTDDLSFATFVLGDVFKNILQKDFPETGRETFSSFFFVHKDTPPLYKTFQKEYGHIWEKYFSGLFKSTGYFPLYDLVSEIFSVFRIFDTMANEEAALIKILEAVKEFEGEGQNSLRDFLDFAGDGNDGESGWNMDVPKDMPAVKVMTIHKSKGLGFPVVLVLLYESFKRGSDYFMEEDQNGISLLKINRKILSSNPAFEGLYREESLKDLVNRLNGLYVGFTRAKEELYVIGVKGKKEGYPFDLLPVDDFSPAAKPERAAVQSPDDRSVIQIRHEHRPIEFQVRSDEFINREERRRGDFVHRVLYFLEYIGDDFVNELDQIIDKVKNETGTDYSDDEMKETISEFLMHKDISGYFGQQADRKIMREQECVDGEGNLYRMDRVIIDNDRVTVLDYKTGTDKSAEEKYRLQMKTYMRILKGIFAGRTVDGIIGYVDLKEIVRI
jgi:ATP-dependent exoDNAse (exonuclease V) beta subunit